MIMARVDLDVVRVCVQFLQQVIELRLELWPVVADQRASSRRSMLIASLRAVVVSMSSL